MGKIISAIANLSSLLIHAKLAYVGETLQTQVAEKVIAYEPYIGFLSDYAATAAMGSMFLLAETTIKSKAKYLAPAIISLMWIGGEYLQKTGAIIGRYDINDVLAFTAGGIIATGIDLLTKSINEKKAIKLIKNTFSKEEKTKKLEELI